MHGTTTEIYIWVYFSPKICR